MGVFQGSNPPARRSRRRVRGAGAGDQGDFRNSVLRALHLVRRRARNPPRFQEKPIRARAEKNRDFLRSVLRGVPGRILRVLLVVRG